jgi:hypothetical protein
MPAPTIEQAATQLQALLGKLSENISDAERSKISDELVSFANPASDYGVPASPAYTELRETALRVSEEVDRGLTRAAIKRIRDRSEALSRFVAAIESVTDKAEKDAQALRLEVITRVQQFAKAAGDAIKEARKAFDEGRTSDAYDALEKVREEIETLSADTAS